MRLGLSRYRAPLVPLLGLLCSLSFIGLVHWRPPQFVLIAEVRSDAPVQLQLRYNRGYGVQQEGISERIIPVSTHFVPVRLPIEVNTAQDLRLVNLGFGRDLEIRAPVLKPLGGSARSIGIGEISSQTPETQLSAEGDIIRARASGKEPVVLHLLSGTRIEAPRLARLLQSIFLLPLAGAALILMWKDRQNVGEGHHDTRHLRRTVVIGLMAIYVGISIANFNGSSTALWRYHADREMPTAGVLLGSPQSVRSDEWLLQTPWIFSQASRTPAFSPTNPGVGSDVTPLVTNLPVRHWSTWFRPQMWPFFVLSPERAFAFYWNFKTFGLLLSAFLFLGVFTGGKTLLDLAGSVFLTFSPYVQWWLSTPTCLPEMLAMWFFALWLGAVLSRARARWQIAAASAGLVLAIGNFVFCCYPRFQIPLVYLAIVLLPAAVFGLQRQDALRSFRLCCVGLALAAASFLTWQWWRDVAEIVRITSGLSYPGQIRFAGGDFEWRRFFDPFLEFSLSSERFPERLANACEAAGFLFLAPFLAVRVIGDAIRGRADRISLVLLGVIGAAIVYMAVGIPTWVAAISGWSFVSPVRAQVLVGVATVILLVRCLALPEVQRASAVNRSLVFAGWTAALFPALRLTNVALGHFEAPSVVAGTALFFALVGVSIWQRSSIATCLLLLVPQFYACALVNPIAQGVPGITGSAMFHWLAQARKNKPEGNWIVFGDTLRAQVLPELVKATGADVLGGMRCNPDYTMLAILDPARKYIALTDRYAWIHFKKAETDTPTLEAAPGLAYDIKIPLSVDLLDRLNVKHILEVDLRMNEETIPGFHLAGIQNGCRLLERD